MHLEVIMVTLKKQTNKYKEKIVILQSIRIIVIKGKKAKVITYTCRYSSGHLIPIIQSRQDELGIKYSVPTRISADVGDRPYFLTFYNYDPF